MTHKDFDINDPVAWGRRLIKTQDHDPVYTMLVEGLEGYDIREDYLKRWLVAYWCLYHCGAASYIAEAEGMAFWVRLGRAASNDHPPHSTGPLSKGRWPRAHERRHWRGKKAEDCVDLLMRRYDTRPEDMVDYIFHNGRNLGGASTWGQDLAEVVSRVCEHHLFGPWIGFKIADMGERVLGARVRFPNDVWSLYRDPRDGAVLASNIIYGDGDHAQEVVDLMLTQLKTELAPPYKDRVVNIQEVETVLCKWKSAWRKHYWIGKDILDIKRGMISWGKTASILGRHLPEEVG